MNVLDKITLHYALENIVDMVIITDMKSVIQYVNPAFTQVTGFTREEALGNKPSIQKSPHTTVETYKEMWSVILKGGWWRGEIINKKKSGALWHSYLSISQIRDDAGKPFAYIGISRDITEMKQLQDDLFKMSLEAIYMLAMAAEAKDNVTGSHLQRVRFYSEAIARKMGMSEKEAVEIGYSSMMHDVGKLHIPDAILQKPGKLSPEEWNEMKKHPIRGAAILGEKPFYQVARDIAASHHERWDGSGYPEGKRATDIPLGARIVAVADVFDALITSRSYKNAWPGEVARAKIVEGQGRQFDPKVVEAFDQLYKENVIMEIMNRFPIE